MRITKTLLSIAGVWSLACAATATAADDSRYIATAGHPSLQGWLLPATPPHPADNAPTPARVALGKQLFFDPRLSGDSNMSCASCHSPMFGWSDGLPTARGAKSQVLGRATPTVINTAYNSLQMWDGRKKDLEDQATGPLEANVEMNIDVDQLVQWLANTPGYQRAFAEAYPNEGVTRATLAKAIASFERTLISNNSPFDRWVKGDSGALTAQQVRGFELFVDADKGNCAVCHGAPNFTDDGFHNIGLSSYGEADPDLGRFNQRPLKLMKGAFKTPTLRDIALTAPYFHDGSAATLMDVVEHYAAGGQVKSNLSPDLKPLTLTEQEKRDLVAFMEALTTDHAPMTVPRLPASDRVVSEFVPRGDQLTQR